MLTWDAPSSDGRFRDPPLRVCDRRQRDLDRRGPRSGGNGAGPDERPAVRVRGAGGEQRRPRCAGEDGGHAARHAECARVAHGHWGRRRGRPGVDRARGRWRLACDGLRVPLRRRPGCAGRTSPGGTRAPSSRRRSRGWRTRRATRSRCGRGTVWAPGRHRGRRPCRFGCGRSCSARRRRKARRSWLGCAGAGGSRFRPTPTSA